MRWWLMRMYLYTTSKPIPTIYLYRTYYNHSLYIPIPHTAILPRALPVYIYIIPYILPSIQYHIYHAYIQRYTASKHILLYTMSIYSIMYSIPIYTYNLPIPIPPIMFICLYCIFIML